MSVYLRIYRRSCDQCSCSYSSLTAYEVKEWKCVNSKCQKIDKIVITNKPQEDKDHKVKVTEVSDSWLKDNKIEKKEGYKYYVWQWVL